MLRDEDVDVMVIRGEDANGKVIQKHQYRIWIDEADAGLLVGSRHRTLEILVVEPTSHAEADEAFRAWLARHPSLPQGWDDARYRRADFRLGGRDVRQYRVFIDESEAGLLVPEGA
jgi:hypothetical protein